MSSILTFSIQLKNKHYLKSMFDSVSTQSVFNKNIFYRNILRGIIYQVFLQKIL